MARQARNLERTWIRVDFALEPIEAIAPWQDSDGGQFPSWFALTDGAYALDLGSTRLFVQDPAFRVATGVGERYSYQVARRLDDLLARATALLERFTAHSSSPSDLSLSWSRSRAMLENRSFLLATNNSR